MQRLFLVCAVITLAMTALFFQATRTLATPTDSIDTDLINIKDGNYAVPPGSTIVAQDGNNSASCGTVNSPCLTVQYAIDKASWRGTIVIREGEYHESVKLDKPLTIQPYLDEKVWFKGSEEVTDWAQEDNLWRKDNWTYIWTNNHGVPIGEALDPIFLNDNTMAGWPDMVFKDGLNLKQVASKAEVVPGTFFVDYDTEQLYVADNPSNSLIEAATLPMALEAYSNANGLIIRGLGFKQYASPIRSGAGSMVHLHPNNILVENNTFAQSASSALSFNHSTGSTLRGNVFVYNGSLGLTTFRTNGLVLEHNYFAYNNFERFASDWEAGGAKMIESRNTLVRENIFEKNYAGGYWCDISCKNLTFVRNLSRFNEDFGMFYELSSEAVIASNLIHHNATAGIMVNGSNRADIYNNTLVANRRNLSILDDHRVTSNPELIVEGIDWITYDVNIHNNILSNNDGTDANYDRGSNLVLLRKYTNDDTAPASDMIGTYDRNAYFRTNINQPTRLVAYWTGVNGTPAYWQMFRSLSDLQASSLGYEQTGILLEGQPTNPWFVDETTGQYELADDATIKGEGLPISPLIADAINNGLTQSITTAGETIDIGALDWIRELELPTLPTSNSLPPTPSPSPTPIPTPTPAGPSSTPRPELPLSASPFIIASTNPGQRLSITPIESSIQEIEIAPSAQDAMLESEVNTNRSNTLTSRPNTNDSSPEDENSIQASLFATAGVALIISGIGASLYLYAKKG